jgi:hypothetical protein
MQKALGFHHNGRSICLPLEYLSTAARSGLVIPGTECSLSVNDEGTLFTLSAPDASDVPFVPAYWFAWYAAFPGGELITDPLRPGL